MMIGNAKEKNTIAMIKMGTAAVFVGMISLSNAYTFTTTRRSTTSFTTFIGRNHPHKSCAPFYSQHSSSSRSFSSSSSLSVGPFSDEIPLIRIGAPLKSPDPEPEPVVSDPEPETDPETEGVEEESVQDDVEEDEPDDSEEEPAQRIVPQTQPRAVGDNGDIPLSVSIGNQQQDDIESIRSSTVTGAKKESFVTSSENLELETDEAMAMEDDYDYEEEIALASSEEPVVPDPEEFYGTVYSGSRSVSGTNNDVKPHFVEEIKSIGDSDVTVKEEDDSDDYGYIAEEESSGTVDDSIEEEEDTEVLAQESAVVEQNTNTVDETETEEKEQDDEDDATDPVVAEEDTIEQVKDEKEDKTEPVVDEAVENTDTDETSKEEEEESIIAEAEETVEADETTTEESIVAEAEDTSETDETESEATTSSTVENEEDEVSTTISDLYTFAAFLDTSNKTSSDFDYDKYKYWNEVISD